MVRNKLLSRFIPQNIRTNNSMRVAVVGGGPAGLLLAWKLLALGHKAFVFEERRRYKMDQDHDKRSYNLTADGLGLRSMGPLSRLIYFSGVLIDGRAIHYQNKPVYAHPYGFKATDHLVSIARSDLLTLLAETISQHRNCQLKFNAKVEKANIRQGSVTWKNGKRKQILKNLDLIAFADGVHGLGQEIERNLRGRKGGLDDTHGTPYLRVTISAQAVKANNLQLDKIHFFPSDKCLAIGLPNVDGTISALIEHPIKPRKVNGEEIEFSPFVEDRIWDWNEPVFKGEIEAVKYFQSLHPRLQKALKDTFVKEVLAGKGQEASDFRRRTVDRWRLGKKGVLVGDAGNCAPPWAGFGMNLACSHASDLAKCISEAPSLESALQKYELRRKRASDVVNQIVSEHGKLLKANIGSLKWRKGQEARQMLERTKGKRTKYQMVAFDEGGLEKLSVLNLKRKNARRKSARKK